MDSHKHSYIALTILIVVLVTLNCFGQQSDEQPKPVSVAESDSVALPAFPYFAEIVGDDVYVRSGPGTNYYRCSKLQRGDIVKIVSAKNVWSRILPSKDSFSWISKQYVTIDAANPDTGVVSGDEVRVYAGSQYYEPIHSDRIQLHLNKGDKVVLLGEEMGDYYKIVPPNGVFFWVSTQYTRPANITELPVESAPAPELKPVAKPEPTRPALTVVPMAVPADSGRLGKYYAVQDTIKAEVIKPLAEQNYSQAREALNELVAADDSDKAARYAQFALGQIDRYELAAAVDKEDKLQNAELDQIYERIAQAQNQKLADYQDLGQYAAVGQFRTSNVYGPQEVLLHYIVVDDKGKVICYALPTDAAAKTDMTSFIGQKVGLAGQIEPHPQTAGALVKFTAIQPLM